MACLFPLYITMLENEPLASDVDMGPINLGTKPDQQVRQNY